MRMVQLLSPPPQTGLNDRCVRKRALHVPQYRNVLIERSPTVL